MEVFAARHGIDAKEFRTLTRSEASMEEHVFNRIPRQKLDAYRQQLLEQNLRLLRDYLEMDLSPGSHL